MRERIKTLGVLLISMHQLYGLDDASVCCLLVDEGEVVSLYDVM